MLETSLAAALASASRLAPLVQPAAAIRSAWPVTFPRLRAVTAQTQIRLPDRQVRPNACTLVAGDSPSATPHLARPAHIRRQQRPLRPSHTSRLTLIGGKRERPQISVPALARPLTYAAIPLPALLGNTAAQLPASGLVASRAEAPRRRHLVPSLTSRPRTLARTGHRPLQFLRPPPYFFDTVFITTNRRRPRLYATGPLSASQASTFFRYAVAL